MIDRRTFARLTAGAALGTCLGWEHGPFAREVEAGGTRSIERIGMQLYSVRYLLEEDFEGTLEKIAAIGFHELEFHDYFGRSPQQVRDLLDRLGLDAPAAHRPWDSFHDDLEGIIESAKVIGHRYVLLAWLPPEDRSSLGQYRQLAAFLNQVGKDCKSAGLKFAYHNHEFEFEPLEGKVPFDVLLADTDPELVEFELDLFWTLKGGHDPVDYFQRHPGRFTLCHVKDMAADGEMVDVGAGEIDFATIFAKGADAGLQYYFIEHDEPTDPLASMEASFRYLEAIRF